MMPPRVLRRLLVASLGAALVLASCAAPSGERPVAPPAPRLPGVSGSVLAAGISPVELVAYDLSTHEKTALRLPSDLEQVLDARWLGPDAALVWTLGDRGAALYRMEPSKPPESIGDPTGRPGVMDVKRDIVLVSSCRDLDSGSGPSPGRFEPSGPDRQTGTIRVLDLAGEKSWSTVAKGCLAALSPEADRVAHSPDGTTLEITDLEGSSEEVLDLRSLDLTAVSGKPYTIKGPIVWSEQGIAVAIDSDGSDQVLTLSSEGDLRETIPLEPAARDFWVDLAWAPEGEDLAVSAYNRLAYVNVIGFVGLASPDSDGLDLVSMQPQFSDVALWAPDGRSLLVAGTGAPWVITGRDGRWRQRLGAADLVPLDWSAP